MIKTTVKVFDRFPRITARVEKAARDAPEAGARAAAAVAQAGASIDLELAVLPAHGDVEGYSAGIKARKKTRNPKRSTPIGHFFDEGTLGKRKKPPKRPRKGSWEVGESGRAGAHTASRQPDLEGKGIEPEHFFAKAKRAGRKAMLEHIDQELGRQL